MKILHTSDWHLGKRLGVFPRHAEQVQVMDEICKIADKEDCCMVVVSGDIFDTFNPPVESIELYYQTARKLTGGGKRPVVAIAGNHDSPDRLESSDPLARQLGIFQLGYPLSQLNEQPCNGYFSVTSAGPGYSCFTFKNKGSINLIHTPFASRQRLQAAYGDADTGLHLAGMWQQAAAEMPAAGYTVLMAHAMISAHGQDPDNEPEGEKPISYISDPILIGSLPKQVNYLAMGHLHRFQATERDGRKIVYSGSPLAYSFSEAGQDKFVAMADTVTGEVESIKLAAGKKLHKLVFGSAAEALEKLARYPDCWLDILIRTDSYLTADDLKQLRSCHAGIVSIAPKFTGAEQPSEDKSIDINKNMPDLFCDYFMHRKGLPPSQELLDLFNQIISTDD
jgi:DNA repair protein SbcD/Mre11